MIAKSVNNLERENIHSRANSKDLAKRGWNHDPICSLCWHTSEDAVHLLAPASSPLRYGDGPCSCDISRRRWLLPNLQAHFFSRGKMVPAPSRAWSLLVQLVW